MKKKNNKKKNNNNKASYLKQACIIRRSVFWGKERQRKIDFFFKIRPEAKRSSITFEIYKTHGLFRKRTNNNNNNNNKKKKKQRKTFVCLEMNYVRAQNCCILNLRTQNGKQICPARIILRKRNSFRIIILAHPWRRF